MTKKYEFTGEVKIEFGVKLHRIRALVAIAAIGVAAGDLGGWIESEKNLSQVSGDAWVYGNARVYGNAQVYGNARYITISPIGSENGCLTAFVQKDGSIILNRGCFSGTIEDFLAVVKTKHGDTSHGVAYRAAVELIKARLDTSKDTAQ